MNKPVGYHVLRQRVFEQALLFMENVNGRKGSLIDLGAGHCMFSVMADKMGWSATALDARADRKPADLPPRIKHIVGDLDDPRNWDPKDYDVIVSLGVHYHLDQEMQHRFFERCAGKPLILDTHFANLPGERNNYPRNLGKVYSKNGEDGADFTEAMESSDDDRKKSKLRASFENPTSWWQTKSSLQNTLHRFGWPHVWTFDYSDIDRYQRTFFVCHSIDLSGRGVSGVAFAVGGKPL